MGWNVGAETDVAAKLPHDPSHTLSVSRPIIRVVS